MAKTKVTAFTLVGRIEVENKGAHKSLAETEREVKSLAGQLKTLKGGC